MLRLLNKASDYLHRKYVGNLAVVLGSQGALVKYQTLPKPSALSFSREIAFPESGNWADAWSHEERERLDGVSCYIALPDYEFCFRRFPATKLPSKKRSALDFLKWRLEQDLGEIQDGCKLAIGQSATDEDTNSLFMIKEERFREVTNLVTSAKAQPKMLLPVGFFVVDQLQRSDDVLALLCSSRVLVFLWEDYWSLFLLNEHGNIARYRSCRWSDDLAQADELSELSAEFSLYIPSSGKALLAGVRQLCEQFKESAAQQGCAVALIDRFVFDDSRSAKATSKLLEAVMLYES
ncbi:MAG: hypothetical protein Marn2KO_15660 [Marinobacter nauticus]